MRYLLLVLSLINGIWMLVDGAYAILNGKYIGPEKPGPWASLVSLSGVDVFKLGPLFVAYGLAWIGFAVALWLDRSWAKTFGIILAALTLWYLPFGTLISIIVIAGLIYFV